MNVATSQGWQYDVDCWELWARPPVLTSVPSQANHSSHWHVQRLKHDLRHALWGKTGYSSGRYQRRVLSILLRPCLQRWTDRQNVGCLRSLESDSLRNTQNSFGSSRSVHIFHMYMCTHTYTCTFHDVYCSKPLTFHNGFMLSVSETRQSFQGPLAGTSPHCCPCPRLHKTAHGWHSPCPLRDRPSIPDCC